MNKNINRLISKSSTRNLILTVFLMPIIIIYSHDIIVKQSAGQRDIETGNTFSVETTLKSRGIPVQLTKTEDLGLYLYRNPLTRDHITGYLDELTGSSGITDIILRNADKNDIPVSLAFSLAFNESSFNPQAVNKNSSSIDRGLFQLNSRSFPALTEEESFNPEINARYGLAYLRKCIDVGENEIAGLAMYNAGMGRVTGNGTPKMTLDYISKIIEYRKDIDAFILDSMVQERTIVDSGAKVKTIRYVLDTARFN